jgi:transmembrane sensor
MLFLSPVRPDWVDVWPIPSAWSQRVATDVGQIRSVRLSDGSSVTLDTDTIVVSRISRSARRLTLLRGRARFDVAHDPSRPFVVAAGGASVAARGTLFDVSLAPGHTVAVTLIRGVVDVEGPTQSSPLHPTGRRTARLLAGQQIAFGKGAPAPGIQPASPAGVLWPDGLLTFEATPLSEAVAEANRYSHSHIRLALPALGSLQVSGVFRATAPRALAESLAAAFDLQVRADPGGDLVLDRPIVAAADPPA